MQWLAQAPSNIALIKYMGKKNSQTNTPSNPSLSYTLPSLCSSVMLETHAGNHNTWAPLSSSESSAFTLSHAAQERFLNHLDRLKIYFNYKGHFNIRSNNNFPPSCGLASSASSFAALTKCACAALSELTNTTMPSLEEQAKLSRQGSGSSCRSFFSPWAQWMDESVEAIDLPYKILHHEVILVSLDEKDISSSLAHQRIVTSPNYATRSLRAQNNLEQLLLALQTYNWASAYQICWREFEDMHNLFSTCAQPFSYITEKSRAILDDLQKFWQYHGDGPIVTMDAGPNIHLLYRMDQKDLARQFKQEHLTGKFDVL